MILEREAELAILGRLVQDLPVDGGKVVLVRGEAGIGKSTLVELFLANSQDSAYTLLGACDDLITPRPLAPVWDVARDEATLVTPLSDRDPWAVMEAVLRLLSRSLMPTILVFEDTQWADEATLDLIKFLGRRIARVNGLLVLTYRDVEVDFDHPLRRVIGDLPANNIIRMPLRGLSAEAVRAMIDVDSFDVDEVLALTEGNPLLVREVVASGTDGVPLSVSDSVLARASKLSEGARRILELVSVAPGGVEAAIVEDVLAPTAAQVAEGVRQGLLKTESEMFTFPHDLQRRAVESSLGSADVRSLNRDILNALGDEADPARLVHHARAAGDIDAIVEFAPRAARAAMEIESTTEAVAHFRAVAPFLDRLDVVQQAHIYQDWGREEFYIDDARSVELLQRSCELFRSVGDDLNLSRTLRMLSRASRMFLAHTEAFAAAREAVAVLEPHGPSPDLAEALGGLALMTVLYEEDDETVISLADRAVSIAEAVGDDAALVGALNAKGQLFYSRGHDRGMRFAEEGLRLAIQTGDHLAEVIGLSYIAGMYGDGRDMERAWDYITRSRDAAVRYEMRSEEGSAAAASSEFLLWQGEWKDSEDAATEAIEFNPVVELIGRRVIASIQMRRGRNEARAAVMRMWSLLRQDDGPSSRDPVAAVVAEYVWLADDRDPVLVEPLKEILAMGLELGKPWPSGALAFWMWKLGYLNTVPDGTADFYGWIISGEYQKSAAFWHQKGIPYEEGLALMHGDAMAQIAALRIFEDLGAVAIANKVRSGLIEQGAKLPRGESRTSRDHAAGLTARQAEVLELLARRCSNAEIADELFISSRTAENHVSAVLMKLDSPTRELAVEAAREMGIIDEVESSVAGGVVG